MAPVDEIVRAGLMRADTITRDHIVRIEIDPDLPNIAVDSPSVAEAIYILVDNASKYAPPGTCIRVRATRADLGHVRLTVTDQGPGIPEEMREQFDRLNPWKECGDCAFIPVCAGGCLVASHTQLGDMNLPTCHKRSFESAVIALAQEVASAA